MKGLFWGSMAVIGYTYLGYPLWLWVRAHCATRPVQRLAFTPLISIVCIVCNEGRILEQKIRNLINLEYPPDLREIVVASDGSIDETNGILHCYEKFPGLRKIISPQRRGKAALLNDAIRISRGEIVIFTDARQQIESAAIRLMVENFADPTIGCVSGELMLGTPDSGERGEGVGLYWRMEKKIREWEGASGSVVGATGALYAVRSRLLVAVPADLILDDVFIPMHVVKQGYRVVVDQRSRAWDLADQGRLSEFARKVRTLSGNYQLVQLAPWMLTKGNPILLEFISHKLMRLLVPFALAALLLSSLFLRGSIYGSALTVQLLFYGLGLLYMTPLKWGPLARLGGAAFAFVLLNAAAAVAFTNFIRGRKVSWTR